MKIVKQSATLEYPSTTEEAREMLRRIERAGRTCYKSEAKITETSADSFCRMIVKCGHESVLEHSLITVRFVCDRGISHELVRHRLASYSQESTRFVNYSGDDIAFISPFTAPGNEQPSWAECMYYCEEEYNVLRRAGYPLDICRSVLPNATKTELVMSMNLREARHFLKLRTSPAAHPQMRDLALSLLAKLKEMFPSIFDDIAAEADKHAVSEH